MLKGLALELIIDCITRQLAALTMHTLLLIVITSGLVLLQTNQGLTANLDPDADLLEEAMADGFIVGTTKWPSKTEKPQDNYNSIVTHDSLNPEANLSIIQKDSLPKATGAKFPEASTELATENTHKLLRNESAAVSIIVDSNKTTTLSPEENAEGSGIFPEWDSSMIPTTIEAVAEEDISSDGSGMLSDIPDKNQSKNLLFPEAPTTDRMITTSTNIVERVEKVNLEVQAETRAEEPTEKASQSKSRRMNEPVHIPEPTKSALVKEGTPGWLIILAFCLTLGAVVCVFIGIGTKDTWYGPSRQCLIINSTKSRSHEEYDRAATLPLSEKEKMALMSAAKEARKETDCTISIEKVPEKEYLM